MQRAVITIGGAPVEPEEDDDDVIKPLPERLVSELTAYRTLALRDAVAGNPPVAMTALLHKLVTDTFLRTSASGGCLEASVRHVFFPAQPDDLKDSPSAKSVAERHEAWKAGVPTDDDALWDWIAGLDDASRMALLATASAMASTRWSRRSIGMAAPACRSKASIAVSARATGLRGR